MVQLFNKNITLYRCNKEILQRKERKTNETHINIKGTYWFIGFDFST